MQRDPARLASVVPTTLRLRLPAPPTAAQSFALGEGLFLLVIWCESTVPDEISDVLRHLIRNELSYLAHLVEDSRFNQGEAERLLAVMNALTEGVVSVDPHLGQANVNQAAGRMLRLPAGQISAAEFAAAMADLARKAVNRDQATAASGELQGDPAAVVDHTWRFAAMPTHVRVRSVAIRQGAFTGRIWVFADESELSQALESSELDRALVRAVGDANPDPQVLLEAVHDTSGRVVDMIYRDLNPSACTHLLRGRAQLLDTSLLQHLPALATSGLFARYAHCADTGEPLILDDVEFFSEVRNSQRRFDLRAAQARPGLISLTWRDVTDRFETARRIAESEERFRLLAENVGDVVSRLTDDAQILWTSNAVETVMGAPAEHWIGRNVEEFIPPDALANHRALMRAAVDGAGYAGRAALIDVHGTRHWIQLHLKPFYDSHGVRDGLVANFHLIDDEVAAEQRAEEARRAQANADALYRRSMDSAAVGMCLASPEGTFIDVNPAMCEFFGYDLPTLKTRTWQELTAPEYLQADLNNVADLVAGRIESYRMVKQYIHADGHRIWGDLAVGCTRAPDGALQVLIAQVNDITAEVETNRQLEEARRAQTAADTKYRRSMQNSAVGMCLATPQGAFAEVNDALCEFFGYPSQELLTKTWMELTAPGYLQMAEDKMSELLAGTVESYRLTKQYVHADGHLIWGDLSVSCLRDEDGGVESVVGQIIDITAEVESNRKLEEARLAQAESDARYRRLMANSNIGMTLITPDGQFDVVNQALCDFFGYDEATLRTKTWQELTAADYLDADLGKVDDVLAGWIDSYRMTKQYIHADGHLIWGDLSVSCLRDAAGRVERFVSQIADITAEMEARNQILQRDQQNRVLTRRLQAQTNQMKSELDSAAGYVASLLPGDLTGAVGVTSRYLPSRELGGDCFGYDWLDDEHLIVYLIDVSGHGIAPALMSISVLNMLRSGSLPRSVLLDPATLLGELNRHFQMDRQGGNYFTIFYGVYHRPTRTLRYAGGGHPPAILFAKDSGPVLLAAESPPVGLFDDSQFASSQSPVPAGSRLLVYSDGAFELPLPGGRYGDLDSFVDLCATQSAVPDWNLDRLTTTLLSRTAGGQFEDDCSLILVQFD